MHVKTLCYLSGLLLCICLVQAQGHPKVNVTVYYESLCPDSRKFFTSQLYPTLANTNVSQWVNLTLVPYGKSNKTKVDDNQWQFSCHHGTYECLGNKIQACAIHEIEKSEPTPAGAGFNSKTVAFINCLMDKVENKSEPGKQSFDFHIDKCADINHVPNYMNIDNCKDHTDGSNYLAALGDLTDKLEPPLKSVPTIVFNGKYKKDDSVLADKNFLKALCQYIPKDALSECKNSAATLTVSVLAFALLLVKQLF